MPGPTHIQGCFIWPSRGEGRAFMKGETPELCGGSFKISQRLRERVFQAESARQRSGGMGWHSMHWEPETLRQDAM